MADKEIERKFLVNKIFPAEILNLISRKTSICQGFLSTDPDKTIRIRINKDGYSHEAFLTVKGRTVGITRDEIETRISVDDAQKLLDTFAEGIIITKDRYFIPFGNVLWELDQFHGENEGLWIAEVELLHEDQKFDIPDWIGEEVTSDFRYANSSLSKFPYSKWEQTNGSSK